jgi:hypothetical protein
VKIQANDACGLARVSPGIPNVRRLLPDCVPEDEGRPSLEETTRAVLSHFRHRFEPLRHRHVARGVRLGDGGGQQQRIVHPLHVTPPQLQELTLAHARFQGCDDESVKQRRSVLQQSGFLASVEPPGSALLVSEVHDCDAVSSKRRMTNVAVLDRQVEEVTHSLQ